jgi:uncharacterized protein YkwD
MPETAKSYLSATPNLIPYIPNKIKLINLFNLILIIGLSGQIEQLNNIGPRGQTLREVEGKTQYHNTSEKKVSLDSLEINQGHKIKQIAINQRSSQLPTPVPEIAGTKSSNNEWGVAEKIDTYTYTMRVQPDEKMATPREILTALNNYRRQHGSEPLTWDDKLASFANSRVDFFIKQGTLDSHAGFMDYLNNQDGFKQLGFSSVGENSSFGFTLEAVHLIEWVYAGDEGHNNNQLDKNWRYAGIGVNGSATDLIFAGNKL